MKINKKLLIPVFATAMGLSVIGGISGAVAWYQYNTKVSASYIGVTTADGGVLQISKDGSDWERDIHFGSSSTKLHPVTFGDLGTSLALPTSAYKHPEAGKTSKEEWEVATQGVEYHQLTMYVQATKLVGDAYEKIEAPVYLRDFVLEAITENKTEIGAALRVHLEINDGEKRFLISPTAIEGEACPLFGQLDLDGSGHADEKGGYEWEENYNQVLTYGDNGKYQVTTGKDSLVDTVLFNTSASAATKVVATIWLEGWHKLGEGTAASAIWDASKGNGSTVHFGLKLDTPKASFLTD